MAKTEIAVGGACGAGGGVRTLPLVVISPYLIFFNNPDNTLLLL